MRGQPPFWLLRIIFGGEGLRKREDIPTDLRRQKGKGR